MTTIRLVDLDALDALLATEHATYAAMEEASAVMNTMTPDNEVHPPSPYTIANDRYIDRRFAHSQALYALGPHGRPDALRALAAELRAHRTFADAARAYLRAGLAWVADPNPTTGMAVSEAAAARAAAETALFAFLDGGT